MRLTPVLLATTLAAATGLALGAPAVLAEPAPRVAGTTHSQPTADLARQPAAPATAYAGVSVTGDVAKPGRIRRADLQALPQQSQRVTYLAAGRQETHTFTGPLLSDVLALAAPAFDPDSKNDLLRFAVLATATDGYAAAVTLGEIDPGFGRTPVLLALRQDGAALELPRLTVRGDQKGGRYVSDVQTLSVHRLG